jgi:lipoate-protein ligase A
MALDQWLLEQAERTGEGFLRLYRWDPFCFSFGRNEPALRRYNRATIEARGISTVRRPTGGRAVWHARELTYAVAAPVATFGDDPTRPVSHLAFNAIHRMLLQAVRGLGVPASMVGSAARRLGGSAEMGGSASNRRAAEPPSRPLSAGACFSSPVGGELTVNNLKILGSAQVREGKSLLQHGSLLLEDDQQMVAELTLGEAALSGETTLQRVTGRRIGFAEASAAVARSARQWGSDWRPWTGPGESALAALGERYRDPEWTWRR